jgi:hypothetical protein
LRLFLHAGAYWIMWGLRASMPKKSMWRVAQFDTLRLRLIKIAARVVEMRTMIPFTCRHRVRGNRFYATRSDESHASSRKRRGATPPTSNPSRQPANLFHPPRLTPVMIKRAHERDKPEIVHASPKR